MTSLAQAVFIGSLVVTLLVVVLLVAVAVEHGARTRRLARDARRRAELTPLVHALLDGDAGDEAAMTAAPALLDELVLELLPQLRGADRTALQSVLLDRGVVTRAAGDLTARGAARRGRAAVLLGNAASVEHTGALVELLGDRAPEVRNAAARALGKNGDAAAVGPLLAAVTAGQPLPPGVAGMALLDLGVAALPSLRAALDAGFPVAQTLAAELLGLHGDPASTTTLIALVGDDHRDPHARRAAAQALGRIGSPVATAALADVLLGSGHAPLQCAAAEALGRIGDAGGLRALTTGLRCAPTVDVRGACADALALTGDAGHRQLVAHAQLRSATGEAARSALDVLALSRRPARQAAAA
ncbi:HEAT repeat domain-containing protein [Modestobacter sp. VKM Ac-2986]|uniref:HEAT repeat domain-containing protein n=1 Tax=Modestobacter sp. VKM Ac-2986 TaxID=3004140 RepID=UPI0022AB6486|nr:HEAT repeat domain-containing protein [Modestobacter sp. VKM Ac-2986]MCZ2830893.1 HEAT repeat domain-containing protein [Modestobacter sp. VKM Ac-2986]